MQNLAAEYDNRAKVGNFPAIIAQWAEDAAAYRTRPGAMLDQRYGPGPRQLMDIFGPPEGPTALFLHGGYWQAMDKSYSSHLAAGLVAHGFRVAIPSYDLCPDVPLSRIIEETQEAATHLGPRPLLAIGHSAGGHLAACLLASGHATAALTLSGLFDLAPLRHVKEGTALALTPEEAHRLSPIHWPRPAGKIHAAVGAEEGAEYTRQSQAIATAWHGSWEAIPATNHFSILTPLADPTSPLTTTALRLARN